MVVVRGEMDQKRLDLVDEGVGDVEVAEGQRCIADDEIELIYVGEGRGEVGLEKR